VRRKWDNRGLQRLSDSSANQENATVCEEVCVCGVPGSEERSQDYRDKKPRALREGAEGRQPQNADGAPQAASTTQSTQQALLEYERPCRLSRLLASRQSLPPTQKAVWHVAKGRPSSEQRGPTITPSASLAPRGCVDGRAQGFDQARIQDAVSH
jgi:hypothetical protein